MPTSCSAYPNDAEAHAAVERLIENGTPGAHISVLTGRLRPDHRDDLVGSFAGVGGPIATYDDGVRRGRLHPRGRAHGRLAGPADRGDRHPLREDHLGPQVFIQDQLLVANGTMGEVMEIYAPSFENDSAKRWENFTAVAALPAYHPAAFLYPTGYGTLGYGLPAAIGAKVGRPEARVIALLGDGGIMFTIAELAAAAQLRLPVVVVDNAGYGEIRNEMAERGDPVHAVDLDVIDFAALGRVLGCEGAVVDDQDGLADALERAFEADRPTVLHLHEDGAPPLTAGAVSQAGPPVG